MSNTLVSVLMPCYNAEEYVREAMESILKQTHSNLEIIAMNDCSTDRTLSILEEMAATDNRIKIHSNEENLRLIRTLNKGIEICNGEYIARMDSDDIAHPTRIEKELAFLENNRDHDIVSTQFSAFRSSKPNKLSPHTNPTRDEDLRAYMLFKSGICHPAVMMRKRIFTELGLDFGMEYLHVEDYALWSQAIYLTKIANLEDDLLRYRVHEEQVSSLNEQLQIDNKKKVFKIHCEQWGIDSSDESLDIYSSVAEANPRELSLEYIDKCEEFMLTLLDKNQEEGFCNHIYLKDMLSMHWLRLCANSRLGTKVLGRLKKSELYLEENYKMRDKVILYVKCLFRLKYKESFIYKLVYG